MDRFLSFLLLVFLVGGLIYSTYSFSQGRFMEGLAIFPLLVGVYIFVLAWQKRQDQEDKDQN